MTEEEELFAWLDGELKGERAAQVQARVAASAELSARAEAHRRVAAGMRVAFDPVLHSSSAAPRFETANLVDLSARRAPVGVPQWAAMAATLALGLLLGNLIGNERGAGPVAVENGQLVAAADLGRSLDTALASSPGDKGPRIGLTFRTADGNICRSFQDGSASGLACREDGHWRLEGLFQAGEGQASDYRMAAGQDPRLAELIDQRIAGEPFDSAQEKSARDKGWR